MLHRFKNKNIVLLPVVVLVLLLTYTLAVAKTLAMRNDYLSLKKEEEQSKHHSQQLSLLYKKEASLDSLLQTLNLGNTSMENNLLRRINREAEKNAVTVIDFDSPHVFEAGGTSFITFKVVFRGNFAAILKTLYTLEIQSRFGEIVHLKFTKQKNFRTAKHFLDAEVFIQKLE